MDDLTRHNGLASAFRLVAAGGIVLPLSFLTATLVGCSGDAVGPPAPTCPAGQWAADTHNYRTFKHDCDPFSSTHFTVFSDGADQASKAMLADIAEAAFAELSDEWEIGGLEELRFTPGYTYYIYAHRFTPDPVSEAARNGLLTLAVDYGGSPGVYEADPEEYRYVVKHELTHVFQFTLTNCPSNADCPTWLDVWFREGQAVVTGGGYDPPTWQELNHWRAEANHINPLRISRWVDFPNQAQALEFYPIFALAYAWLVDAEAGHGATVQDVKKMFRLMGEGASFHGAFEEALGISVEFLEENFFALMEEYLE